MNPGLSTLHGYPVNRLTEGDFAHEHRVIETRGFAEREPGPRARIKVQNLVFEIAPIKLEFYLYQPRISDRVKQFSGRSLDSVIINDFHEGTGMTEFYGILSRPARCHFRNRPVHIPKRGIGKLRLATSRDQVLHDNCFTADEQNSFLVELNQLRAGIRAPGLRNCQGISLQTHRRLYDDGKVDVDGSGRVHRANLVALWKGHAGSRSGLR